jgi:transporter family protein
MHTYLWLGFCVIVVMSWGVLGVFEKLASNLLAPESALIWVALGFMLLQPLIASPQSLTIYSRASLMWALLNGVLTGLGFLGLLSAMRHGGKASIVEPLSALYPVLVVLLAPSLLGEKVNLLHGMGVAFAVIAVVLLTREKATTVSSQR